MKSKVVALGELIVPARPVRAGAHEFPLLSMTMSSGLVDQKVKFKKRIASLDTSQYKVVSQGQLVVGFPIDEGVLDVQSSYPQAIVSPAYGVWDIRDDLVDGSYLVRLLRSERALAYYRTKLQGTTGLFNFERGAGCSRRDRSGRIANDAASVVPMVAVPAPDPLDRLGGQVRRLGASVRDP